MEKQQVSIKNSPTAAFIKDSILQPLQAAYQGKKNDERKKNWRAREKNNNECS